MKRKTTSTLVLCADCPLWRPHEKWDGGPVLLPEIKENSEEPVRDSLGMIVYRKDKRGEFVRVGRCAAHLPIHVGVGRMGEWPQTLSIWDCDSDEKRAALQRRALTEG